MSKQLEEIRNAVQDSLEVFRTLKEDMDEARNLLFEDASNFRLRTYLRTFFALVEGTLYGLKQVGLKMHEHQSCFTYAEVSLLREVSYELGDRGRVREKTKFLDTLNNLRFTVKCFSKVFGFESENLFNGTGWQRFQQALEIRHQITHPKNASSLVISEVDDGKGAKVDIIVEASEWYANLITELSRSTIAAIMERYKVQREEVLSLNSKSASDTVT
jgi:hypothetical protein